MINWKHYNNELTGYRYRIGHSACGTWRVSPDVDTLAYVATLTTRTSNAIVGEAATLDDACKMCDDVDAMIAKQSGARAVEVVA